MSARPRLEMPVELKGTDLRRADRGAQGDVGRGGH